MSKPIKKCSPNAARRSPGDERLFFHEPFANAEWSYWASQGTWSLEQAAALLLEKDPDVVSFATLDDYATGSIFAAKFAKLLFALDEAKGRRQLAGQVTPSELVEWARAHRVKVPPNLVQSIEAAAAAQVKCAKENAKSDQRAVTPNERTAWAKERQSLLKILAGVILEAYTKDAFAGRDLAREITGDLHSRGIPIDEDTVRKWLNEAREVKNQYVTEPMPRKASRV